MLTEVEAALPADIAIFAAAVADWRVAGERAQKLQLIWAVRVLLQTLHT